MFTGQTVTDFDVHSLRLQEQRDYAARHNLLAGFSTPPANQPHVSIASRLAQMLARPFRSLTLQHGT